MASARTRSPSAASTTVREELKDTDSAIEEAKADVSGLWVLKHLADHGKGRQAIAQIDGHDVPGVGVPVDPLRRHEAHGRGIAMQLNDILEQGAFMVAADDRFTIDDAKMAEAVTALTRAS